MVTATLANMWMPDATTLRLVLPELLLVTTVIAVLLAALVVGRRGAVSGGIALIGALLAASAAASGLAADPSAAVELFGVPTIGGAVGPGMMVVDPLSGFFRVFLMLFLAAIVLMWFLFDAPRERFAAEFFVLLVSSALGMALMAGAVNLLLIVIAIELASLPSYALAGFERSRRPAAEAALKYAIFGAVTAGFMVYGVSVLYGLFGTLHVPTLVARLAAAPLTPAQSLALAVALLALFAGVGFKISAVPFHFWCPDVFEGASLPVATWLSVASKAAGLVLLLRLVFLFTVPDSGTYATTLLPLISNGVAFFAVLTCTVANLAAYGQSSVRRLLAYSSIAHAGYMLCAGAVVFRAVEPSASATSAVVAYLMIYLFMNLGAFVALGLVARDTGREDLEAFNALGWRDPATAVSLTICLVSLIGLPPLGGFIVKWWLIYALGGAAHAQQAPVLWVLVAAVVVNTALSLFYYARVFRAMFLVLPREVAAPDGVTPSAELRAPLGGKLVLHACAVVLLLTGTLLIPALKRNADAIAGRLVGGARGAATAQVDRAPVPTP